MSEKNWIQVCFEDDLINDTGICAKVNSQQIAIFKSSRLKQLFAISNYDPIGEANVLSRGIIGSLGEQVVVASPLYKEHYDLRTGTCVEKPEYSVKVFPVTVENGVVQIQA